MFAEEFSQISDLTFVYSLSYLSVNPVKIKILQFMRQAAKARISEIPSKPQPVWNGKNLQTVCQGLQPNHFCSNGSLIKKIL